MTTTGQDTTPGPSARAEWASMWPIPLTGLLGVVACSSFAYSYGVFMLAITHEFGWSRTEFGSAFVIQSLIALIAGPIIGRLTDRFGPRRIALWGIVPFAVGLSAIGLANGVLWQWNLLCAFFAATVGGIGPTVWVAAASRRFDAGRGLAMGVVLAGTGVGTAIWPLVATALIALVGWRLAYPVMAVASVAVLLPLTLAFIKEGASRTPSAATAAQKPQPRLWPILRSRTFFCLLIAGCLFVNVTYGVTLHLVPMLTANGFDATLAASAAVIAGATTLIGRVVTGWMLDVFPTRLVGIVAFLLPVVEVLCLWLGDGSVTISLIGVALLGFSAGAESDVLVYLASRRFPRSVFASVYSIIGSSFTVAAGLGPLIAGAVFDATGAYAVYYLICIPLAVAATAMVAAVPANDASLALLEEPKEMGGRI